MTRRWGRYIVVAGAAALAASLMLTLMPRAPRDPAIEQALAARDNALTPSRELDGHDPVSVEAADQAMSAMLGNPVRAPDLGRAGFKLVSAEIYGQNASRMPSNFATKMTRGGCSPFFCVRPPGPDTFEVTQRGPVRICVWQNADLTAVMTGELSTPNCFVWRVWHIRRWACERRASQRPPLIERT